MEHVSSRDEMREWCQRIVNGIEKKTDDAGNSYEVKNEESFMFGLKEPYELAAEWLARNP